MRADRAEKARQNILYVQEKAAAMRASRFNPPAAAKMPTLEEPPVNAERLSAAIADVTGIGGKGFKLIGFFLLCAALLCGCVKRAVALDPTQPTCSAEPLYTVCASRAEWVVVSKSGPHDKELCPHGAVCTIEAVGTMYRIRRIH